MAAKKKKKSSLLRILEVTALVGAIAAFLMKFLANEKKKK